jgi:hypothetical protein
MTTSAATTDLLRRIGFPSTLSQVSHPTLFRHVSTVINQPLATMVAYLRSAMRGTEGSTAESDPTIEVVHRSWRRQVDVRYILYEVPGGAQVTASIASPGHSRLDPMTGLAVRSISRRIVADLAKMRDALE